MVATRVEITSNQIRSMKSRYLKGETAQELAGAFKVSTSTVLRLLREAGTEIRQRGRRPSDG